MKNQVMDSQENINTFPLSKNTKITGKRRAIREKILQILVSYEISETSLELLFNHIFFREFQFGDEHDNDVDDPNHVHQFLDPQQIEELEADTRIVWPKEELAFAHQLLESVLSNRTACEEIIVESAKNWEYDRISYLDKKIMAIAICEFLYFPEIPPKVTINEAIDLGKKYSTEKSGTFINGVLDNVISLFKKEGKMTKTGKGLK